MGSLDFIAAWCFAGNSEAYISFYTSFYPSKGKAMVDFAFRCSERDTMSARRDLAFLLELLLDCFPLRDRADLVPLSFISFSSVGVSLDCCRVFFGTVGVSCPLASSSLGVCRYETSFVVG